MAETKKTPAKKAEKEADKPKTDIFGTFKKKISKFNKKDSSSLPIQLGYIYLAIPMYIFFFGWLKTPVAMLMFAVLTAGLLLALKSAPKMDVSQITCANLPKLALMAAMAVIWVYLSGIGGFAFQNYDHMWRNGILEKLVDNDWPVIITDTQPYFQKPVAMIYYFALWLPAACVGKVWGMQAAYTFLFYWCVAGVLLVMTLISGLLKKFSPWIVLAFICFSGLDAVGDFVLFNSTGHLWFTSNHLENWAPGFQMSSMTTQLFWVFNQAIPAWVITLLLLHQKDNRSIIFIYAFSFMGCTLPSIGMLPILACIGIRRIIQSYDKKKVFKDNAIAIAKEAFTIQNAVCGVMMALLSFLFLKSNSSSSDGFRKTEMDRYRMSYLLFIFLEFMVYYFAIYTRKKRDPLYWVSMATLLIVPMISFGPHIDFVMRASIPGLVVLFILIMSALAESSKAKDIKQTAAIIILLSVGGLTAYHEIVRSVNTTIDHGNNPEVAIEAEHIDLFEDGFRNNFFGEYEDSFFFKYLAKKK
ncbi:MAG: hypothetical protein IJK31_06340 [Ruminococcus sp.]|nr:hypothetical protein [Ruminococcus sp.]HRR77899.1 hypothetical protein [Ruminococcus sp.]